MGLPSALPGQEGCGPIKEAPRSLVYSLPFSDETHTFSVQFFTSQGRLRGFGERLEW